MSENTIHFYQTGTFTVGNRLLDESQRSLQSSMQRFNSLLAEAVPDSTAQVNVTNEKLHRGIHRKSLMQWDNADIPADNGVMTSPLRNENETERLLAVWSLLPYSREYSGRSVSLEITSWGEFDQMPVAIDLLNGRSFDLAATLKDGVWRIDNLQLGVAPILIRFSR